MPIAPTYPGVYIEEISSGVRTIVGVATSRTVFIGRTVRGPQDKPVRVQGQGEFERNFGPQDLGCTLPDAVKAFFEHGGSDAVIVRVAAKDAAPATATVNSLPLRASGAGVWGNDLAVRIDYNVKPDKDGNPRSDLFNLYVQYQQKGSETRTVEVFRNLSVDQGETRYYPKILEAESLYVEADPAQPKPTQRPGNHADIPADASNRDPFGDPGRFSPFGTDGKDGGEITDAEIQGNEEQKSGIWAMERFESEFNLMVIPPLTRGEGGKDIGEETWGNAAKYCRSRRALLIVDSPGDWQSVRDAEQKVENLRKAMTADKRNAAVFFPRLKAPDPLREGRTEVFPPGGAVAGIFARTDSERGVWKSPAGIDAGFVGVPEFSVKMTDGENGRLNPLGVNCLRYLPGGLGNVIWGSRTLDGADRLASEWKYLAVRRFALFLEESLFQGTQWVVFEPNDEPLWSQIRLNVGAFMHRLFRQGAFQGRSPKEAYYVRCDKDTTPQADINLGIVNIEVGFAPLKPAEFVIIKIQQMAGQIET